jgi:hypothetical protein
MRTLHAMGCNHAAVQRMYYILISVERFMDQKVTSSGRLCEFKSQRNIVDSHADCCLVLYRILFATAYKLTGLCYIYNICSL